MIDCRRCRAKTTVRVPARGGGFLDVTCPVCSGIGVEFKRLAPPPPNAHFDAATDMAVSQTEHDQFMAWLEEVTNE